MDVPFLTGGRGSAEKSLPIQPTNRQHSFNPFQTTAVTAPIATGRRSDLVQLPVSHPTPQPQVTARQYSEPFQTTYAYPTPQPLVTAGQYSDTLQTTYTYPTPQPQVTASRSDYSPATYSYPTPQGHLLRGTL